MGILGMENGWSTIGTTIGTETDSAWNTIQVNYDYGMGQTFITSPPKPKTNLDWLDERVNEMRVRL